MRSNAASVSFLILLCVAWSSATTVMAQAPATQPVLLWPEGAPGATGQSDEDKPAVTVYLPEASKNTGAAILVCPGGGFLTRCTDFEGTLVANWLKDRGIAAFILRYRIRPIYTMKESLADAQRGMQFVRSHASEFQISANRIGIIGFSAGAELAASACIRTLPGNQEAKEQIDRAASRPDFLILAYGSAPLPANSQEPLPQDNRPAMPPTFMFCTAEDAAHLGGMLNLYTALRRQRVPVEAHFFQSGEHGVGFALGDPVLGEWPELMFTWVRANGFLTGERRVALRGIVKLDGQPLARGEVVLTPIDIVGAPPIVGYVFNTGPTRGEFVVGQDRGAVPGRYRVEVRQDAERWMSNAVNPMQVKMQQKQRSGTLTEADRKEWIEWARKRDLSPSLQTQRVYRRQRPGSAEDLIVEVKSGEEARIDIDMTSR